MHVFAFSRSHFGSSDIAARFVRASTKSCDAATAFSLQHPPRAPCATGSLDSLHYVHYDGDFPNST